MQPDGITSDQAAKERTDNTNYRGADETDRVRPGYKKSPEATDDESANRQPYQQ